MGSGSVRLRDRGWVTETAGERERECKSHSESGVRRTPIPPPLPSLHPPPPSWRRRPSAASLGTSRSRMTGYRMSLSGGELLGGGDTAAKRLGRRAGWGGKGGR